MLGFLKELYLTGFTLGFRFSGSSWSSRMNSGKGVACVAVIEWIMLVTIGMWIDICLGTKFFFGVDRWTIRLVCLALYIANYYVLVFRGHGITFEQGFSHLKKSKQVRLKVGSGTLFLVAMAFFFYTVSAYHRYFHIIPKHGF
jgi:uncharacterized membrane protein